MIARVVRDLGELDERGRGARRSRVVLDVNVDRGGEDGNYLI